MDNKKILIVEDNPMNQFLTQKILEKNNFNIFIAENGQVACEEIKNNTGQYSIILMDLMMPVMNGYDASIYIRKTLNSNIPIIAVTADVTSNVQEKCVEAGMNDYISKPYNSVELVNKIKKHLDLK